MESPGGGLQTRVLVFTHYPNMAQTESRIGINGKYWKKTLLFVIIGLPQIIADLFLWMASNRGATRSTGVTQQRIDLSIEVAAFPKSFQFAHTYQCQRMRCNIPIEFIVVFSGLGLSSLLASSGFGMVCQESSAMISRCFPFLRCIEVRTFSTTINLSHRVSPSTIVQGPSMKL